MQPIVSRNDVALHPAAGVLFPWHPAQRAINMGATSSW